MSKLTTATDFTSLWCDLLLEELYRNGARHICLAPGSRSAPLALAVSRHKGLCSHTHFDERGLGFFALGLARSTSAPVVLVTTSGTAVANLYPSLLEARETGVPLLVITADRPPELLGCGANQTIEQPGIFASCPDQSVQLPCPDPRLPARWLLSVIDEAMAVLKRSGAGVFHINQALRDPLYGEKQQGEKYGEEQGTDWSQWLKPLGQWLNCDTPLCRWISPDSGPICLPEIEGPVVLVAGQLTVEENYAVSALAERSGWLLIADIQSGLQGHPSALPCADLVMGNPGILEQINQAQLVIQCGRRFISKRLSQWLAQGGREHWFIDNRADRQDPVHSVTLRMSCSIEQFCYSVPEIYSRQMWRNQILKGASTLADQVKEQVFSGIELTEAWIVEQVKIAQKDEVLFIGNSMPIRYLDSLSYSRSQAQIFANRGVSGIDGLIATASGHSAAGKRTVLIIGDLSFLHDLGSLALASQQGLVIILLNNSGGTIFNLFPVPQKETNLPRYFRAEHSLQCGGTAEMFGLNYHCPASREQFNRSLDKAMTDKQGSLIEVCVPVDQATDQFQCLVKMVREASLC